MGERSGSGRLSYFDRDNGDLIYDGEFQNNLKNGFGELSNDNGTFHYKGQFQDDVFHGEGELKEQISNDSNSFTTNHYHGEFENHMKHGRGQLEIISQSSSTKLNGVWEKNLFITGNVENFPILSLSPAIIGVSTSASSSSNSRTLKGNYHGTIENQLPNSSNGNCNYEDGSKYIGNWKNGKKNGYGEYIYSNGDRYDGKWVGDMRCGYGKFYSKINSEYEGQWEQDQPHGNGIMFYHNHTYYVGSFMKGLKEGTGQLFSYDKNSTIMSEGGDDPFSPATSPSGALYERSPQQYLNESLHPGSNVNDGASKDKLLQQGTWVNDRFVG
jgi:hypothetical protein